MMPQMLQIEPLCDFERGLLFRLTRRYRLQQLAHMLNIMQLITHLLLQGREQFMQLLREPFKLMMIQYSRHDADLRYWTDFILDLITPGQFDLYQSAAAKRSRPFQLLISVRPFNPEVDIGVVSDYPPTRGAHHEPLLDQVGLEYILDGVALFADRGRKTVDSHRATAELFDHRQQKATVHVIKAALIHIQHVQRQIGNVLGDTAITLHFGKVARSAQQSVGDSRRAARATCHFTCALFIDVGTRQSPRAHDNAGQILNRVILKPLYDSETVTQGRSEQARPSGEIGRA